MEDNFDYPVAPAPAEAEEQIDARGHNYSLEAERYVIGCVLLDSDAVVEVMHRIDHDDFYDPRHKAIMQAMEQIYERDEVVEYAKVWEELKKLKKDNQVGGPDYIATILDSVPSVANITSYVEIIEEKSLVRRLMSFCENTKREILAGKKDFKDLSLDADEQLQKIIERRKVVNVQRIKHFTEKVIEMAEGAKLNDSQLLGLDTGFVELNRATSGFQKGELIILAARPGIGKSALAMNIATYACRNSKANVAYFSLEMSNEQLAARILSSFSGIGFKRIRDGKITNKEMLQLTGAQAEVNKLNLYLDVECNTNLDDIRAKCTKLKREDKLDLIVVDYLQLVTDTRGGGSRQEEVSRVSRGLKKMARDFNCPVLALSQLSREVERRNLASSNEDHEPGLSDLRESGSIEQDADVVLFLHRPNSKQSDSEVRKATNHQTKLIIAKNRQGEQTKIPLIFRGPQFTFSEVNENEKEEVKEPETNE
ncbi:MAG: replicative DNA helicase [Bacilli bacterium]|nr:replicative DNA helicase [Bacilli bacterium]